MMGRNQHLLEYAQLSWTRIKHEGVWDAGMKNGTHGEYDWTTNEEGSVSGCQLELACNEIHENIRICCICQYSCGWPPYQVVVGQEKLQMLTVIQDNTVV